MEVLNSAGTETVNECNSEKKQLKVLTATARQGFRNVCWTSKIKSSIGAAASEHTCFL